MKFELTKYEHRKYKCHTKTSWKNRGMKFTDEEFEYIYGVYISTENCMLCDKEFTVLFDRCLDYDHSTGEFRYILCQKCKSFVPKEEVIEFIPEEDFNGINPNARKIQKEALKLLEDNKTFFEKIPVSKGYGKQKSINTNTNYYKEQKHNLINKTLYGSDNEATRRATFYLNKLTDRLKNKTAEMII